MVSLGVGEPGLETAAPADRDALLGRTAALGARWIRIDARWSEIEPERGGEPHLTGLDEAVTAARSRGLRVLLLAGTAPRWAEGPRRPRKVTPGAWRPDPQAFARFARALAGRLRPDAIQIWNEPNLPVYLAPQWQGRRAEAPRLLRALTNAAYPAIKAASPRTLVVSAGTAPYGEPRPGGSRMPPARFWRELLDRPTRLDVLTHHPYGVGSPRTRSPHPDDVTFADLPQLTAVWRTAQRTGRLLPRGRPKPRWITEFGWESAPDPRGVTPARQARFLREGVRLMARAGFSRAFWFRLRDERPRPDYAFTSQSGLLRSDGARKPAARTFAALARRR